MLTGLAFILVFSILIFIHEFGHFLAAKKAGMKVEEFGFGFPPRIFGIKIGETIYSINWILFGGFVKIYGQGEEVKKEKNRSFLAKSKKARALVISSGIIMNFLLAVTLFSVIYAKLGIPKASDKITIVGFTKDSPAREIGLELGDVILGFEINGQTKTFTNTGDFIQTVDEYRGQEINLQIERQKKPLQFKIVPRTENETPQQEGPLGVAISSVETVFYPWWKMIFASIFAGFKEAISWVILVISSIFISLKQLVLGKVPQVAGPIGIYYLTRQAAKEGLLTLFQFTGILSVNLAVLNFLPLPLLDGGWVILIILENFLTREKIAKLEQKVNIIGIILFSILMILVTVNDFINRQMYQ